MAFEETLHSCVNDTKQNAHTKSQTPGETQTKTTNLFTQIFNCLIATQVITFSFWFSLSPSSLLSFVWNFAFVARQVS